ncbi:FkbM family methyltransferase [Chloroflexota bacterium]
MGVRLLEHNNRRIIKMALNLIPHFKRHLGFVNSEFEPICNTSGLNLSFSHNRYGVSILRDIFNNREYSDFFPFYEDSVIVDVGAHYGYFSLFASKNSDRNSSIIAIEPVKENYEILCKNITDCGLSNIKTVNMALSDTQGIQDIFKSRSHNCSSFSKDSNLLSSHQSEKVETLTLSDLFEKFNLQRIDFVKMDCEGAEYPVLLNSDTDTLSRIRTISIEFHDLKTKEFTGNRLARHLEKCGFRIVKFTYSPTRMNLNYGKLIATKGIFGEE